MRKARLRVLKWTAAAVLGAALVGLTGCGARDDDSDLPDFGPHQNVKVQDKTKLTAKVVEYDD